MLRVAISVTFILGAAVSFAASQPSEPSSSGTGFLVNDGGWAITNAHVVDGCTRLIALGLGDVVDLKTDRQNDLAALRIENAIDRPFLALTAAPARLGDDIAAFGYPLRGVLSDAIKVTTGNINSLVGLDNDSRFLQVSTPLQPGNSGGPIVDRTGNVVGVATSVLGSKFAEKTGILPQNVNFAIRSNVASVFLQSHGIDYQTAAPSSDTLSTADLAEKTSPAVLQILCFTESPAQTASLSIEETQPPATRSAALSVEQLATSFAHAYHQAWSSENVSALNFMNTVYVGPLEFYGKEVSAVSVLTEKRKFAERWPVRDYSVRDGSLRVSCTQRICSISALVDWFAHSPSRRKSSNGVATFEFVLDTDNLSILRETGSVIKGQTASPNAMIARWNELNRECRGGSGNEAKTWQACDAREYTGLAANSAGWCYGREGEYGYQMSWHRCGGGSLR